MSEARSERLDGVRELLAREGLDLELSVAGADDEIVAIRASPGARAALARLAPGIRAAGFRYVTIELDTGVP